MIQLGPGIGPSPMVKATDKAVPEELQARSSNERNAFSEVLQGKTRDPSFKADRKNEAPSDSKPIRQERSETEDSKPVPENERLQAAKDQGGAKQAQKDKAMLKFMDSMESEFGVPPERMLEAMARLKPADLVRPPEETATQIIENLDLSPEDESRAIELYAGFLQQWRAQDQDPAFFPKPVSLEPSLSRSALEPPGNRWEAEPAKELVGRDPAVPLTALERKKALNESIDRMNDRFFLRDEAARTVPAALTREGGEIPLREAAFGKPTGRDMDAVSWAGPWALPEELPVQGEVPVPDGQLPIKESGELLPTKNQAVPPESEMSLAELSRRDVPHMERTSSAKLEDFFPQVAPVKAAPESLSRLERTEVTSALYGPPEALSGPTMASTPDFMKGEDSMEQDGKPPAPEVQARPMREESFFTSPLAMDRAVPTSVSTGQRTGAADPNMQAIMNQAQLIVHRGGGEATVKLNPEGLGEVKLKVMVLNGHVNVEMATQTQEAKSLIENSLSDLKNSLASHKLSVDQVKVDVGNQTQADLNSNHQRGMDMRQDLGRDQARNFFNHFREDTASRRDPFYEMPGIKAYQRRHQVTPLPPAADRQVSRYAGEGRGERMHVVA